MWISNAFLGHKETKIPVPPNISFLKGHETFYGKYFGMIFSCGLVVSEVDRVSTANK